MNAFQRFTAASAAMQLRHTLEKQNLWEEYIREQILEVMEPVLKTFNDEQFQNNNSTLSHQPD